MLAQTDPTNLLVCGTNSFNPKCRTYSAAAAAAGNEVGEEEEEEEEDGGALFRPRHEFSGKGFCPYDPRHNSTAIFTGERERERES